MVSTIKDVEQFVTIGILPENLPPIFDTAGLWAPLSGLGTGYAVTNAMVGDFATYSASKRGGQRRIFGIPHPIFIRDQALFFMKNWAHLDTLMKVSKGSTSKPEIGKNDLRVVGITPHSELPRERLMRFSKYQFCLVTDVSRFYPSIYTHTIPWILNGKSASKTDTSAFSATIFGNRIDFLIRQTQSRQTIGMPVGPDTSKVVAELIMSGVDKEFARLCGNKVPTFLRHVDDIWIGGNSREECEKHLQHIGSALRAFQLDVNDLKTKIVSTREILGDAWPFELVERLKESLKPWKSRDLDPVSVMSRIIEIATRENDDGYLDLRFAN